MEFVHPYLTEHENDIVNFITTAHDQLKAAGSSYLKQAIAHCEEIIFGTRRTKERPGTFQDESY